MRRERGFSLIELMVALVMTLIVSGAIYGLMASGQGSFKREPALIDRQQNIRVALDMIVRDLENAGSGMTGSVAPDPINPAPGAPPLVQVFTPGLDSLGPVGSAIQGGALLADAIEALVVDGSCPTLRACHATSTEVFVMAQTAPACMAPGTTFFGYLSGPGLSGVSPERSVAATSFMTPGMVWLNATANAAPIGGSCPPGVAKVHFSIPAGFAWINHGTPCPGGAASSGAGAPGACQSVTRVSLVRYELAGENPALPASFGPPPAANPPLNPPSLWRSEYGRRNVDGSPNAGPYIGGGANNPWQMVARGIDDMQIDYQTAPEFLAANPDLAWLAVPPAVNPAGVFPPLPPAANMDNVVRRVRIRLSARAIGANLGGENPYPTNPGAEPARRGQLTTIVTPRSALKTVGMDTNLARNWR